MISSFKKASYLILVLGGFFLVLTSWNAKNDRVVLLPDKTPAIKPLVGIAGIDITTTTSSIPKTKSTTVKRLPDLPTGLPPGGPRTKSTTTVKSFTLPTGLPPGLPPGGPSVNLNTSSPIKIPHIFHQTWDSYNVPKKFVPWIRSFVDKHPEWEYWFWTPDAVRLLLKKAYPDFIPIYDAFDKNVFRANSMRYFIMYYFGGVYADLDLEFLKNIDPWTSEYNCFASEDAHVHAYIVNDMRRSNMMITILGCRPDHPYYSAAIKKLSIYSGLKYFDKLNFADSVYIGYNNTDIAHSTPQNSLDIVHPDYFMGSYDSGWVGKVKSTCSEKKLPFLSKNKKKLCLDIISRKYSNSPKSFAYSNHHWVHVIMKPEYYKTNTISIFEVLPNAKNVTKMIENGEIDIKPFQP